MAKTITRRPKLAPRRPADFDEATLPVQQPEEKVVSPSRSEVEVWNSTFPRRAWLGGANNAPTNSPQVRPAGHERGEAAAQEAVTPVSRVLTEIERTYVAPVGAPGLCRTCARLTDCTYPRPEGGVWHCDEYE